ncbi:MAG: hypothetical protein GY861_28805 [bacterium]|nr:hypothetical protein [bacterium]
MSTADRDTINASSIFAVADTTANTLSIYSAGSVTIVEAMDNYTDATERALCYVAKQGSTDLVIQSDIKVQMNKSPLKLGHNFITYDLYGLKTFTE